TLRIYESDNEMFHSKHLDFLDLCLQLANLIHHWCKDGVLRVTMKDRKWTLQLPE
ncbi:Hypothetical predicted protein, partial [Olea europaea subsp. europaea]